MNIKIEGIENAGIIEKERVVLSVLQDDEIGQYAVFKTKKSVGTAVSTKISDIFWFTDHEVKKGDLIFIYTKVGKYSKQQNDKGGTSHFFYWNKTSHIWGKEKDVVVLLNISEWDFAPKQ